MEIMVTTGAVRRAKFQSNHLHQQTNIHFLYRPDALPVAQPTVSKHWMKKYQIPWTCWPQAHLGVFQLCLWPLIAPGYLGEGCHASHQPSDASTPKTCINWLVLFFYTNVHDPLGRHHWSLSFTHKLSRVSKSLTTLFGMRHLTYGTNFLHLFAFLVSRPPQSALLHRQVLTLLLNR